MLFTFIGTYIILLLLFYSSRYFGNYDFIITGIIIGIAAYLEIHANPAFTTLTILSGKADTSDIFTIIIPQISAAILAALTVNLLR